MQQEVVYKIFVHSVVLGVFATFIMDLSNGLGKKLRLHHGGSYLLIGRWIGGFFKGQFRHRNILEAAPKPYEKTWGLFFHYLIGIVLAFFYVMASHVIGIRTSDWGWAVAYGTVTNILPWFVMFPAFGFGVFALKGPPKNTLLRTSFFNHLGFGFALALGSTLGLALSAS